MTQQAEIPNHGETLQQLFQQGVGGQLTVDQFEGALQDFQQRTEGTRFELHLNDGLQKIIFCAGSWAIGLLYGSHDVATKVAILGESVDGPQEIAISRYHNPAFEVKQRLA